MGQISELTLDEWMLALSTIMAMPSIIILLVVVFMGKFPASEEERYLALNDYEVDYWDITPEEGVPPVDGSEAATAPQARRE